MNHWKKGKGKKLKTTTNKHTKNSQQTTFHTLDKIYNNDINLILSSYNSTLKHGIQRMIKKKKYLRNDMFSSVKSNTQALKNHYNLCTIIIKFCVILQSVHVIKQNLFYAVMFVNLFFLRKWSCCDIIGIHCTYVYLILWLEIFLKY